MRVPTIGGTKHSSENLQLLQLKQFPKCTDSTVHWKGDAEVEEESLHSYFLNNLKTTFSAWLEMIWMNFMCLDMLSSIYTRVGIYYIPKHNLSKHLSWIYCIPKHNYA